MFDKIIVEANKPHLTEEQEQEIRTADTQQLIHDIVGKHVEYFADPANRLDFIKNQSAKDFFMLSQYINAKLRGQKPYELRRQKQEWKGGALPLMHTPASKDKTPAFKRGFDAIQEYIATTDDSVDRQIEGVAMATEALIIWVHPFIDGNGRTSRFLAKLIEDGADDMDDLITETASGDTRSTGYRIKYPTKEWYLADANNEDIMLDDEERDELRKKAETLPTDVEGMYLSIKLLLEDDKIRDHSAKHRPGFIKAV